MVYILGKMFINVVFLFPRIEFNTNLMNFHLLNCFCKSCQYWTRFIWLTLFHRRIPCRALTCSTQDDDLTCFDTSFRIQFNFIHNISFNKIWECLSTNFIWRIICRNTFINSVEHCIVLKFFTTDIVQLALSSTLRIERSLFFSLRLSSHV